MKAIVYTKYGPPEVLQLKDVEKPVPKADEVLVKVYATSLNASDLEFLTANPVYVRAWGPLKPKYKILGSDIAGRVEAVGANVREFRPGDEVFGDLFERWGGLAEYVCAPEKEIIHKPAGMTFEEAAALPQSALVALQGLRNKGQVQPGQRVLINGAGGGAGTFAIQIAKLLGAEVTGVDSAGKLDMMLSIGADHVIDYTSEDFTRNGQCYDLVLDLVASHSIFDYQHALCPEGKYVMVGGSMTAIFQTLILGSLISMTGKKKMSILGHKRNKKDMAFMTELFEAGKVVPVIDRRYPLSDVPDAFRYFAKGLARGKIVINV